MSYIYVIESVLIVIILFLIFKKERKPKTPMFIVREPDYVVEVIGRKFAITDKNTGRSYSAKKSKRLSKTNGV